jgi:hypothetical protein
MYSYSYTHALTVLIALRVTCFYYCNCYCCCVQVLRHFSERFDLTKVLERRSSRRNSLFKELAHNAMRRGSAALGLTPLHPRISAETAASGGMSPTATSPGRYAVTTFTVNYCIIKMAFAAY